MNQKRSPRSQRAGRCLPASANEEFELVQFSPPMADSIRVMASAVDLDSSLSAMRLADWTMVHRQFGSLVSACTPPPQKTPGKAHIQLPAGNVSFPTSGTMSGLGRHLIKATKSAACHAN